MLELHVPTIHASANGVGAVARDHVDALHPAHHSVQFYLDDAALAHEVAHFVQTALAAGDAFVIAATPEHLAQVRGQLCQRVDLDQATREGRLVAVDARTTLDNISRDGQVDRSLFQEVLGGVITRALTAAVGPAPRVSVYGELVALLSAEGRHDQALALEGFWNELIAICPIRLHCGYPLHHFARSEDVEAVRHICDAHSVVMPAEDFPLGGVEDEQRRATVLLQQRLVASRTSSLERDRAEAELISMRSTREDFLVAAAHELKTPVTSLRVYAQLLRRDLARNRAIPSERLALGLEAIERQTTQLNRLIGRLLDVAQIETGSLRLSLAPCDLVRVVERAIPEQATHRFAFDLPDHLVAVCDQTRIGQVAENVIANALKFSPPGSLISVDLRQDARWIRLRVTDEGCGVDPEQRERIFERFHRGHEERNLSGLGLGLYIAREVLSLHGGAIRAEQPEHSGARFVIELPVIPDSVPAVSGHTARAQSHPTGLSTSRQCTPICGVPRHFFGSLTEPACRCGCSYYACH